MTRLSLLFLLVLPFAYGYPTRNTRRQEGQEDPYDIDQRWWHGNFEHAYVSSVLGITKWTDGEEVCSKWSPTKLIQRSYLISTCDDASTLRVGCHYRVKSTGYEFVGVVTITCTNGLTCMDSEDGQPLRASCD